MTGTLTAAAGVQRPVDGDEPAELRDRLRAARRASRCPQVDDAGQLVGSLLAQVLMIPPRRHARPTGAAISSVLAGLSALDVLTAGGRLGHARPTTPSCSPPARSPARTPPTRNGTLADLVTALDAAGSGAVVAGDAASAGGHRPGRRRSAPTRRCRPPSPRSTTSAPRPGGSAPSWRSASEGDGHLRASTAPGEDTQPVPPVPAATP